MFKNFYNTIRCYKVSSILNVVGLTVAFTAFTIIMIQVNFDRTFDDFHAKGDRTFRLEYTRDSLEYSCNMPRPLGEIFAAISPNIELNTVVFHRSFNLYTDETGVDKAVNEYILRVKPDIVKMFDFKFIEGDGTKLATKGNIIVSRTVAEKFYPNQSALGKEIFYQNSKNEQVSLLITGVYEDFPKNSMFYENNIVADAGEESINDYSESSFYYYVTLTDADKRSEVEMLLDKYTAETFKGEKVKSRLNPFTELHFNRDVKYNQVPRVDRTTMSVLFSVAMIILIIAAINFLNFAMALTPLRLRSINIHKVMGGTVARLRLHQVSEAVFLSFISFGLALLLIKWISTTTFTTLMTAPLELSLNIEMLIISGVIAIVTGIVAGLFPAFYSTSFKPAMVIKGSFGNSKAGRMFRTTLIGFQYVSSLVLFCAALFMIVQNQFMKNHPVGFNRDNILSVWVSSTVVNSQETLRSKLLSNPQIKDVAFSAGPIISSSKMGWGRHYKQKQINFDCVPVSSNFIKFMGMEIVEGRDFNKEDELKPNGTIIFNEKAVKEYDIKVGDAIAGHVDTMANIVGVVRNFNFEPMQYGINPIALYVFGNDPWWELEFLNVRVAGDNLEAAISFIDKTIKEIDPKTTNVDIQFLDERVGALYKKEQNQATMIIAFAIVAMIISLVGVFGLVIFETQYRRKEIGLRKINGATNLIIITMFNQRFVNLVCVCFVISFPISWYAIDQWLLGFAYRTPMHWWIFALSLVIVVAITILTVTIQSWRAASENPVDSLKNS